MKLKSDPIQNLVADARIGGAREFRDGQPLTREGVARVITRFNACLADVGRTADWAALSMGVSPASLQAALTGNAPDGEPVIRAMDAWLEAQGQKARRPHGSIARTRVTEAIYAAAKLAMTHGGVVLAHGPAGIGKTITGRAICAMNPGSIFISIKTAGQTASAMGAEFAEAMPLRDCPARGTRAAMFRAVERELRDTGRMVVVDEIHKLAEKRQDEALHWLRDLHDAAGVPMLWMGMPGIASYIQSGHARGYERLDQIYSRINLWLDLTEMADGTDGGPGLATIDDIRKFLAARELRIVTPDGERYLQSLANELGAGAYRTLDKLLQLAVKLANGSPIDAAMLRAIQTRRLGIRAAETLETRMTARAAKAVGA